MILANVDSDHLVEPMDEGIRVIQSGRGETYSPAYVQGISGAAFHVGGIYPCAPTCTEGIEPIALGRKFGYQAEAMPLFSETLPVVQRAPDDWVAASIERIKTEIRANRPALVWNAFSACEWNGVTGFTDDAGTDHRKLFFGRSPYPWLTEALQTHPQEAVGNGPACGAILIGEKTGEFDAQAAEIASQGEAVAHAHSQNNADQRGGSDWAFLPYERWVNDFRNPPKPRTHGDASCCDVYRRTHRAASDCLAELDVHYPLARHSLLDAAHHFAVEAEILSQGESRLWWSSPESPDPVRNQQAAALLDQACASYRRGIDAIEQGIDKLV